MGGSCSKDSTALVAQPASAGGGAFKPPSLKVLPPTLSALLEKIETLSEASDISSLLGAEESTESALSQLQETPQIAAAAHCIAKAIDRVLKPHLDKLEQAIIKRATPSFPPEVPNAVGQLCALHDCLWQSAAKKRLSVPAAAFEINAINFAIQVLRINLFSQTVVEMEDGLISKRKQLHRVLEGMRWPEQCLVSTLNTASKDFVLYLDAAIACGGERKVPFAVHRDTAFLETLQQVQQKQLLQGSECGGYKFFPRFYDPLVGQQFEGGEGHGPRKELFNLLGQQFTGQASSLFKPAATPKLFSYNKDSGIYWFRTGLAESPTLKSAYKFVGWLMAHCIINRATLGVPLAPLLFKKLLMRGREWRPMLADLQQVDPQAAKGLQKVRAAHDSD